MLQRGVMVYWRFKGEKAWRFGYTSDAGSSTRMGPWNGNTTSGPIVDECDIEWKPYYR